MKLIDKDAVLAEIEKLFQQHSSKEYIDEAGCVLDELEDIINILEVKEVDLEKEYEEYVEKDPVYKKLVNGIVGKAIAKHFFELGTRASNPITAAIEGSGQAEKDLELTWEDIRELHILFETVDVEIELGQSNMKKETLGYYEEVLRRFISRRNT